jgi:F-type H+-transporting ATPase subunit b
MSVFDARLTRAAGAFFLALALPAVAMAAEAGEHGVGGEHAPATFLGLPQWIWLTLNLILFLGALFYFLAPPLTRFLDARAEEIRHSLRRAAEQLEESKTLRAGVGAKIAALEAEVRELEAKSQREGERERGEILAEAGRERERMLAQTREEIAYRLAQARQQLTAHTAALAAQLAEERLARELTPADRNRVFERNLRGLDATGKEAQS